MQFSPVYDGGEKMKDGAKVPLERTATPVELDQVYGALDQLSAALGPNGANKDGALSDLVDVGAANLDGNGEALNRTLTGFSQAVETLSDHRNDLFSSLDNLQAFTSALAGIDAQVGQFNDNMAAVADQLSQERADLAAAVSLLNKALADVSGFVRDNTTLLSTNVNRLADVTLALVQQRQALAEVLDVAPAALGNLAHAYNPDYGTLDTRDNSVGSTAPEVIVCQILAATGRVTIKNLPIPATHAADPGATTAANDAGGHLRPPAVRRRERRRHARRPQRKQSARPPGAPDPARRRRRRRRHRWSPGRRTPAVPGSQG